MLKISDAIEQIVSGNPLLEHGFSNRLFNLTQLAKYLKPLIEARTKKEITSTALLMALSRMQRESDRQLRQQKPFKFRTILIYSNLCTTTFPQTRRVHQQLSKLFDELEKQHGFFSQSENSREITLTIDNRFAPLLHEIVQEEPKYQNQNVACVEVQFSAEYFETPGLLHALIQKITLQNINLIEVSSTYTGFCFFVEKKDMKLAFETLHDSFLK
ncbi:ACT domain-containing protein [bacterium]|jgi:aspartokinase|nr:ACT domain-containing protein [bacterium]MBT6832352.1 ACT domain-containing protein [bacterium]MBT6996447.1 ACT domain-containing protein [bacterium]MBT7772758.1 ACT domain-containing protein [bacterium]